jgi:hypothetical protein
MGMVTIQTDDGFATQLSLVEMLKKRNLSSTFYINTNPTRLNSTRYMSEATLKSVKDNNFRPL